METLSTTIGSVMEHKGRPPIYRLMSNAPSTSSTQNTLENRPLIASNKRIEDIIKRDDLEGIKNALKGYAAVREKMGWDDYAAKLSDGLRTMLTKVFSECRRQGFLNPHVVNDKLVFNRIVYNKSIQDKKSLDRCTLCARVCQRREDAESGKEKWLRLNVKNYEEPRPCWAKQREER